MTQHQEAGAPVIYPVLSYRDARAAMAWLERAFGFKKVMEAPTPDGGIAHAEMSFGDGMIMLATAKDGNGWKSPLDLPAVNQTVYVYVGDVDTHYQREGGSCPDCAWADRYRVWLARILCTGPGGTPLELRHLSPGPTSFYIDEAPGKKARF